LFVWYVAKHKDVSLMDLIDDAESRKPSTDFGLELPEMGGSDDGRECETAQVNILLDLWQHATETYAVHREDIRRPR
jgi:hypothetical protein